MAISQHPRADETARRVARDHDQAVVALDDERSFAPRRGRSGGAPPQVVAFAAGTIDQARAGHILMVSVRETEVDSQNWEPFARWLVDEVRCVSGDGALILDLRRVTRLSSRGLRALALAWQELAHGGVIAVCGLSPILREIFQISQYDRLFEIHPDAAAAFTALSATPQAAD
ncbi:STAS domain-containing protein [uncultured Phenylobacterium sp.]|uniref:STAS domain-containing protein n=1 Tax=uncultured Phenylobacterium sp. TaxID=349273 RepID=UPI0025D71B88|nr:STAS domain-containing protein [uncultured Phenylobacterium sp.]